MKLNTAISLALAATLSLAMLSPAIAHAADTVDMSAQTASAATVDVTEGQMLYAAGKRVAAVYRVANGNAQVIYNGKMVVVPASTLAVVDGKLTTSLTVRDLAKAAR